jgi:hypothetical protein
MAIYRKQETNTPPTQEEMVEMGEFTDEQKKAGVLISRRRRVRGAADVRVA